MSEPIKETNVTALDVYQENITNRNKMLRTEGYVVYKQQDLKQSDLKRCPQLQRRWCDFRLLKADLENGRDWLLGEQAILCSRYLEVSRGGGGEGVGGGLFTTVHYMLMYSV